jgi:hypothetical protein
MRARTELVCLVAALDHLLETKNEVREKSSNDKDAPSPNLPSLFQVCRQNDVSVLSYGYTLVIYRQIKKAREDYTLQTSRLANGSDFRRGYPVGSRYIYTHKKMS